MSRTYRRKNSFPSWLYNEGIWNNNQYRKKLFNSEYHKKEIIYYKGDFSRDYNCPKYFRQSFNRKFRSKNKAILNKIKNGYLDYNETTFKKDIKNANWYWF